MDGVALRPLTVAFHEPGFIATLNGEGANADKLHWGGPVNPQALNRYAYVQNNPMRWTDPTGHVGATVHRNSSITIHLTHDEAIWLWNTTSGQTATIGGAGLGVVGAIAMMAGLSAIANAATISGGSLGLFILLGKAMEYGDYAFGEGGLDIRLSPAGQLQGVSTPTVDRQHDLYFDDPLSDCFFKGRQCEQRRGPDPCTNKLGYCGDSGIPVADTKSQTSK